MFSIGWQPQLAPCNFCSRCHTQLQLFGAAQLSWKTRSRCTGPKRTTHGCGFHIVGISETQHMTESQLVRQKTWWGWICAALQPAQIAEASNYVRAYLFISIYSQSRAVLHQSMELSAIDMFFDTFSPCFFHQAVERDPKRIVRHWHILAHASTLIADVRPD